MKKSFILVFIFFSSLAGMNSALAHAQVTKTVPSRNEVLSVLPQLIWIEFDGDLMLFGDKNPNSITVTDARKNRIDVGNPIIGGARISTKTKSHIKSGRYKVSYRVVSEDGHVVTGSYSFTYSP
jgi:methionine-rich copper-binding protein CopC